MPATAASRYCSGLSESSFSVASVPSGRLPTMSVKVPPRSIQNCQRARRGGAHGQRLGAAPRSALAIRVVMSCTGRPVAARTASAYGGMLVHSRTIAATSGRRATRRRAAATVACAGLGVVELGAILEQRRAKAPSRAPGPSIGVSARRADGAQVLGRSARRHRR